MPLYFWQGILGPLDRAYTSDSTFSSCGFMSVISSSHSSVRLYCIDHISVQSVFSLSMFRFSVSRSRLDRFLIFSSAASVVPCPRLGGSSGCDTSSGSIRLSNLHLEFNGSEPNTPTTQHSDAHGPQPGDRDNFRRLVIEPLGYNLRSDVGMAKIILKCIGTHYNCVYPNWSSIPLNTQGQMFNEFKRSEIGKMARASEKGGSLHTGGAISQVTRKERMEKELGRPVDVAEMFKVTHVKKSTNSTEEERWIEPRAQETYDRYIRISHEYHSTLPLESQDRPFTQEENENLWKQSAGEPIRGSIYGYPEKAYQKKKSWYYGSSS
ncbi:hypothetical protein KY285_032478 [Solanum tuberosum]|nr:hypothetical protein KY285_032478 [Solanum tuberosum]